MVSYQTPFPILDDQRNKLSESHDDRRPKTMKRKWNDSEFDEVILPYKHWKNPKPNFSTTTTTKSLADLELHLESPLPSEWQRCLDIQSGEIHFYNTRTQRRTLRDPSKSGSEFSDPPSPRDCPTSLDLELNLPCGSLNHNNSPKSTPEKNNSPPITKQSNNSSSPPPPPQPRSTSMDLLRCLSTPVKKHNPIEEADESTEMVATACNRCHMLVMLSKSSPTCPNCKYVHPPSQNTIDLFKPKLSLSY